MTRSVSNLIWQPTNGANGDDFTSLVTCDASVDISWSISITGSFGPIDKNIEVDWLTVDNLANNALITVGFGPFSFTVAQYKRESFALPKNTRSVSIIYPNANAGLVNCWFSQKQPVSDSTNQLLVQTTAVKSVIYGYLTYTTSVSQTAADQNSNVRFNPTAGDMIYTLLPIVATPVANGWFQFIKNTGTKKVTITPTGDTVLPANLILYPGDSGWLSSDGSQWFFDSVYSKTSQYANYSGNYVTANQTQVVGDKNTLLVANPTVGTRTYTLLPVATAAEGFQQTITNVGTQALQIVPDGAETINAVFTATLPLVLNAGDTATLYCDGSFWYADISRTGFNVLTFSANQAQTVNDRGDVTEITVAAGGNVNYTLLAHDAKLKGWAQEIVKVDTNDDNSITLLPSGADTINGIFTNANPMKLYAGSWGTLFNDGTGWRFRGMQVFRASAAYTTGSVQTVAHGLGKRPLLINGGLRCVTANNGWAVGDIHYFQSLPPSNLGTLGAGFGADNTNIYIMFGSTLLNLWSRSVPGNNFATVVANWNYLIYAYAMW